MTGLKLLLLSDSHREMQHLHLAIRRERPHAVLHLGDYVADADELYYPGLPILRVRGNCDRIAFACAETLLRDLEGVRVFAAHGHRYGVKQSLLQIAFAGREKGAQVVAFGHTHQPYCAYRDGLWLINPGACSGSRPSYGVVNIEAGQANCRLVDMYKEETP